MFRHKNRLVRFRKTSQFRRSLVTTFTDEDGLEKSKFSSPQNVCKCLRVTLKISSGVTGAAVSRLAAPSPPPAEVDISQEAYKQNQFATNVNIGLAAVCRNVYR